MERGIKKYSTVNGKQRQVEWQTRKLELQGNAFHLFINFSISDHALIKRITNIIREIFTFFPQGLVSSLKIAEPPLGAHPLRSG